LPKEKGTYRLAIFTAIIGLFLFIPFGSLKGLIYNKILIIHIILGLALGVMLFRLIRTHIPHELSNPFKSGEKKWKGFKLLLYLIIATFSGIIVIFFQINWLIYFHGAIGLWSLFVGWKHKRYEIR
jgi:zinc transporter ZupT